MHGVRNNGDFALAPEAVTLAELLADHGWATAAFVGATVLGRSSAIYGMDIFQGRFLDVEYSLSVTGNDFRKEEVEPEWLEEYWRAKSSMVSPEGARITRGVSERYGYIYRLAGKIVGEALYADAHKALIDRYLADLETL